MEVSIYVAALDPGLFDRKPEFPSENPNRSIGRPVDQRCVERPDVVINWPWTPHGRARRILTRSGARRRYSVPCFRGGERYAHCESPEEATAAVILDACWGIQFQEHPAIIKFHWRNEWHEHRPDSLVVDASRKEFWELKKDHEAESLFVRKRSERLVELLAPLGFGYRVVSTSQLLQRHFYRNAMEMRRRAKLVAKNPLWLTDLRMRISRRVQVSADVALGYVAEQHRLEALYSLLYHGELRGTLAAPVTLDMHVHPPLCPEGERPWLWELLENGS